MLPGPASTSTPGQPLPWAAPGRRQVGLILGLALLLMLCRTPRILLEGRVFAEEGTTYLRYAWNATPLRALLAPHQGYYSLLDNVCALLAARVLPLSAAGLFFAWMAAAVQLLVVYLAVECEAFRTGTERLLAMLALLLVTPTFETWLSLENCQWLLAVAAGIILVSSTERLFALRSATLLAGALSGVTTVPFIPLFWLRAWRRRERRAAVLALVLTLPAALQSAILLHSMRAGDRTVTPHHVWALAAYGWSRMLALPLTTGRGAQYFDALLYRHAGRGGSALLLAATAALAAAGFAFFRRGSRAALALYSAALLSAAFDWYGCVPCTHARLLGAPPGEGRYFFPANSLLLLALLLAWRRSPRRPVALTASVLFGWLLATGGFQYFRMRAYLNDFPAWLPQVRRWQADERQPILVAPAMWREHPLRLTHRHPDRGDLPVDGYDSSTSHPVP
jgi:hypothetical protein